LGFDPEGQPASLQLQEGPDETMKMAFFGVDTSDLEDIAEQAVRIFALDEEAATSNPVLEPGFYNLKLTPAPTTFQIKAPKAGRYALVCEHHPDEFSTQFVGLKVEESRHYKPDHEHDDEVSSVGVKIDGNLDQQRFRDWLGQLLREKGTDIYRMKGIVALEGIEERFVFQGVHMLFDGKPDRPWGTQERECQMIFIGRNLDRHELTSGLEACRA
jgi:G3E family GTPase